MNKITLTEESLHILSDRGLNAPEIFRFAEILSEARAMLDNDDISINEIRSQFSESDLNVLRKVNGITSPESWIVASKEQVRNYFAQPDQSDAVDLDDDGTVSKFGIHQLIEFPPQKAPNWVHEAWNKTTEHMTVGDKQKLMLDVIMAVKSVSHSGSRSVEDFTWSQQDMAALFGHMRERLQVSLRENFSDWAIKGTDFYNLLETNLNEASSRAQV